MKKFALVLISTAAMLFGFGLVAEAQTPVYPSPGTASVTPASPGPGQTFTARVNCTTGAGNVTFTFNGVTTTAPCVGATATATLTAPTTPGTFTGTAVQGSTQVASFSIAIPTQATTSTVPATTSTVPATTGVPVTTVAPAVTTPAGGLPATGSDGISTTTGIAIGLLVVGLGLFVVAQVRRRQPSAA